MSVGVSTCHLEAVKVSHEELAALFKHWKLHFLFETFYYESLLNFNDIKLL